MRVNRMTFTQPPPAPGAATTGVCPDCQLIMEVCTCRGRVAVLDRHTETIPAPTAGGGYGDWEDRDNQRGPERDETDTDFRRLVRQLVDEGDDRAAAAGRQARRTLKEMAPGTTRQPVLHLLTRPLTFTPTLPAAPAAGAACTRCEGTGGQTIDTSSDGVSRQHWQSCQPCGGTGVAR